MMTLKDNTVAVITLKDIGRIYPKFKVALKNTTHLIKTETVYWGLRLLFCLQVGLKKGLKVIHWNQFLSQSIWLFVSSESDPCKICQLIKAYSGHTKVIQS